ncbi:MAG: tripartite tricarboxylate transporter substrate binding protein [Proteobacteria bacterium]|nr:tripartite tricarboxylate transporter substrate binding protein [Pseudomonadota bacterium]
MMKQVAAGCTVLLAFTAGPSFAQEFPAKPVRLVVSYPPGGSTDTVGRIVAQKLGEGLGTTVVVENRAGAGGTIGADAVAKAVPDGYSLLVLAGAHALAPNLYVKLPYDIVRDFAPVGLSAKSSYFLVTHPSVPARTVKELIALARSRPGSLNYASTGIGTAQHLSGEMFNTLAQVRTVHVVYKGDAPALTDLIGGHVEMAFLPISVTAPLIRSGKLRGLGVTSSVRTPLMPELPTLAEAGGLKDFDITTWWGVVAPAGTPAAVVARLAKANTPIAAMADVKSRFGDMGIEPAASSPSEFAAFIRSEVARFSQLAKLAGVKPE